MLFLSLLALLASSQAQHAMNHEEYRYFAVELPVEASSNPLVSHQRRQEKSSQLHSRIKSLMDEMPDFEFVEQIGQLPGTYLVRSKRLHDRDVHPSLQRRVDQGDLEWIEEQVPKQRMFPRMVPRQATPSFVSTLGINDPGFPKQWHLYNSKAPVTNDHNVSGVWLDNVTGKGSLVCIMDDGLDITNPDLSPNFVSEASYDFNTPSNGHNPKPGGTEDRHGTRCAGEVAAVKGNSVCGVGMAYDTGISAVRILSSPITEADEATAINYEYQKNQIYSCSWGPPDDGQSVDRPAKLPQKAFENGVANGRGGKGSIYIFAAGNGGDNGDNCNYDGYVNSPYSMSIAALSSQNTHPSYSEACPVVYAVAYSSDSAYSQSSIYTDDIMPAECTGSHGGTSAAAPLAAGIMALSLQVRPDLTWRDALNLVVNSAVPVSTNDASWEQTASGRMYSYKFGYGKLDAWRTVNLAKTIPLLPNLALLDSPVTTVNQAIPQGSATGVTSTITITNKDIQAAQFDPTSLNMVSVTMSITHQRRGDLRIILESPNGIKSVLATERSYDISSSGLKNWTMGTIKHWNENPVGAWTLRVIDTQNPGATGQLQNWQLRFWGSVPTDGPITDVSTATPVTSQPTQPTKVTSTPIKPTSPITTTSTRTSNGHVLKIGLFILFLML